MNRMIRATEAANHAIIVVACEWLINLHDDAVMNADKVAFADWLLESPVHVREYLLAETTWECLSHIDWSPYLSVDGLREDRDKNVVTLSTTEQTPSPFRSRDSMRSS